jgi:hypothetical protein
MAANRDAGVDPRFDPVFQRGYDPSRHGSPARRAAARPVAEPAEAPADTPVAATSDPPPAEAAGEDELEPRPRNPYRVILLLVSLAAIAGAGVLLWNRIEQDPYGGFGGYGGDTARVFVQQFTDSLMVPLLTGGVLGLCLWLALGALRRRDHG